MSDQDATQGLAQLVAGQAVDTIRARLAADIADAVSKADEYGPLVTRIAEQILSALR